jgi:hypothetical protein
MGRRERVLFAGLLLLTVLAVTALAGEAIKVVRGQRFDLTDQAGRLRASVRLNAQGRPEIVTYAEDGAQDGLVSLAATAATAQEPNTSPPTGRVRGVVTYYFNRNYGARPDVGAEVWLLPGILRRPPNDNYVMGTSDAITVAPPESPGGKRELTKISALRHSTVDGNGNFSWDGVPPGEYTVAIQSAHRDYTNQRDILHGWMWVKVKVEAGRTADTAWEFPAYAIPD